MSLRVALGHLERGDWQKAHAIAQNDDSALGAWLHAIVHVQEGDLDNARYWFGQARRPFSPDIQSELSAFTRAIANAGCEANTEE